jgi:hypothetical protein
LYPNAEQCLDTLEKGHAFSSFAKNEEQCKNNLSQEKDTARLATD